MTWQNPELTLAFCGIVLFWFTLSCIFSLETIIIINGKDWVLVQRVLTSGSCLGLGLGFKVFVTTYLFYRFPRLRHKLDVTLWFLDRLPTDRQLKKRATST